MPPLGGSFVSRLVILGIVVVLAFTLLILSIQRIVEKRMDYDHESEQAKAQRNYEEFIASVEDDRGGPIDDELAGYYREEDQRRENDDHWGNDPSQRSEERKGWESDRENR